jgi:hypothetical protein
MIAGVIGLAGGLGESEPRILYDHWGSDRTAFHDVRSGSTASGGYAKPMPIDTAGPGYDGPTGLGTPDGLAAFMIDGGVVNRSTPRVSVKPSDARLTVAKSGRVSVTLANTNPFAVPGTTTLRAALSVDGRTRTVRLARARLSLGPLATATTTLPIPGADRALLAAGDERTAGVVLSIAGPAGGSVTRISVVRLSPPAKTG